MRALVVSLVTLALTTTIVPHSQAATTYPLTLNNCGQTLTIAQAPQRVVAIKSTAVELLLSLGLGSKIVGVGFLDAPVPDQFASLKLPVLSDKLPSQEVVLEKEPDFIFGGWESNFSGDGAGERATLTQLGITSYVAPAACRSVTPTKLTFDALFSQFEELGKVFNIVTATDALIAEQKAGLHSLEADDRALSAVWYSSATKTPYVGAGTNAPAMLMEALGLDNVFADVAEGWTSTSWEAVADADPDVIILVDASWNSATQKKRLLAENPVTKEMRAVKNNRYLIVPFSASEAGVRNVPAVLDMAKQLEKLTFE